MEYGNKEERDYSSVIAGRNPVTEALRAGTELECIYMQVGERKGPLGRILGMAKEKKIIVKDATADKLEQMSGTGNHQGVVATLSAANYKEMEDIFERAGSDPLFVVVADCIEDPHNLGAIIRTAEAAGAHGVIIPKRHSAGLTATAVKSSAGAALHLPIVRVANLAATIDDLKKNHGVWFYCADMDGSSWCQSDYSGGVGLVIGSEGEGVSRLIKEKCDFTVSMPLLGEVNSLNASVAGGIIMYEIARQRLHLKAKNPN